VQNQLGYLNMDCGSRGADAEPELVSPSGSALLIPLCFFVDPAEEQKGCTPSTHCSAHPVVLLRLL